MQNGSEDPASDSQVNGMTRNDGIPGGMDDSGEVSLDREQDQESGSVSSELCNSGRGNDPFIDLKVQKSILLGTLFLNLHLLFPLKKRFILMQKRVYLQLQAFKFTDLHSCNGHRKILEIAITFIFVENGIIAAMEDIKCGK